MQRAKPASEETKNSNLDDESRDGGVHGELERQDDVDLPDERPAQLRALRHPGVQRSRRRRGSAAGGPRLDVAALLVP